MRIRSVSEEFEVQLHPPMAEPSALASSHGKGEWKTYTDGARLCKVWMKNLRLPEGTRLQLAVNGRIIGDSIVERGSARFRRETEHGEVVPGVRANDILQVLMQDKAILEGAFYAE